ncbi:DASH complex subunit ask1 [Cladophialophora chaetospira]|uniref:DASH complex subunit ASK1 n=1 Tax=Cladophialophora chaetospira TaxID=386627 RepID=A0AA38XJT4_9EURO|nr:DASH complex subunit ask1 [Cladophialophora chaetospira]
MSRSTSTAQPRALTLTEELEKLEQSITLTLQGGRFPGTIAANTKTSNSEIDHNFSRAHRIVTSSILPIVEQYAVHSKEVWEGSRFWKQFFESSANVSLSGYEEQASHLDATDTEPTDATVTEDSNATTHTTLETSESYETPSAQHISTDSIQDLDLSNMTISPSKSSTPRPFKSKKIQQQQQQQQQATFADYPSPYETLRQEVNSTVADATSLTQASMPETPGARHIFPVDTMAATPQSSPFLPPRPTSIPRPSTTRKKTDPLLHRILDRNYRVQATPLTGQRDMNTRFNPVATPPTAKRTRKALFAEDSNLDSSPAAPPPELNHEIFSSPERKRPIPGVSVLTPMRGKSTNPNHASNEDIPERTQGIWDSSDDDLDDSDIPFDASPPKTIHFHIPQNRLLKTPAKEASQRIVQDILTNAGLDYGEEELDFSQVGEMEGEGSDIDGGGVGGEQTSPSVVRRAMNIEDQTF